jgi:hypothetical protein
MNSYIQLINQFLEIKQKINKNIEGDLFERNFNRISSIFESEGYFFNYPLGEKYNETRTDCEASIVGEASSHMIITDVIKPIIYKKEKEGYLLVQKGIVIVEKA